MSNWILNVAGAWGEKGKKLVLVVWILRLVTCFCFCFCLLNIVSRLFGPLEEKQQRTGYTHRGDINIYGIRLLCEVLASILLNMHECLK